MRLFEESASLTCTHSSYLAKRDLTSPADAGPVAADIAVRNSALEARAVPTHIQWCLPGSTIYVNPVQIGAIASTTITKTIIEELVLSTLEAVDAYIHTHGPGFLLVGNSWNFVSPMDSRYDIHVHGATTYLVLQGGLESMLNYMQTFNYFATGTWNFFDHVNVDVAQALLRFNRQV